MPNFAICIRSLALALLLVAAGANAQLVDRSLTLFGMEPTFQDLEMVNEPGRLTLETPHKREKFEAMIAAVLADLDTTHSAVRSSIGSSEYKPGVRLQIPGRGDYLVDMEPVCIEWNQLPVRSFEMIATWAPIFSAANRVGLVPYINPAAERSGMGHFHVGGHTVATNPYFRHPTLLRNMMVTLHQHPSLLWGFAEAYDIGLDSNIETYHEQRQSVLRAAVAKFDRWYKSASPADKRNGAFKFLGILHSLHSVSVGFFQHYRFLNLQHVKALANGTIESDGQRTGKYTIEHRNFRPAPTAPHAQALTELLLRVMDKLAPEDLLTPWKTISSAEYTRFHSATVVSDDWSRVVNEFALPNNQIWNDMIGEYVNNQTSRARTHPTVQGLELLPAYSEKYNKGKYFEMRTLAEGAFAIAPPEIVIPDGPAIDWRRVTIGDQIYWLTVVRGNGTTVSIESFLQNRDLARPRVGSCETLLQGA